MTTPRRTWPRVVLVLALVTGCAGPQAGYVTGKECDDPDTWITPGYNVPGSNVCTGSGSTRVCTYRAGYWVPPVVHHDPECWRVHLKDDQDREGSVCLSHADYDAVTVGQWLDATGQND